MGFCSDQLERLEPLWRRMLEHPFLLETRDGTLRDEVFAAWLLQDYLFVEATIPFVGLLLSRAPAADREAHAAAIDALHDELGMFRERADALGVALDEVPPSLVNHAYVQFLLATAHAHPYRHAHTVYYVAEKAYHKSWKVVRAGLDPSSPWQPFVENWSSGAFAGFVDGLEARQDRLAEEAGPADRREMERLFETTVRYEIAFWEMAYTGAGWPGLPEEIGTANRREA